MKASHIKTALELILCQAFITHWVRTAADSCQGVGTVYTLCHPPVISLTLACIHRVLGLMRNLKVFKWFIFSRRCPSEYIFGGNPLESRTVFVLQSSYLRDGASLHHHRRWPDTPWGHSCECFYLDLHLFAKEREITKLLVYESLSPGQTVLPTQANSSQVGGETIPNSIKVVNLARVGLSWEYRLARALHIAPYRAYTVDNSAADAHIYFLLISHFSLIPLWCDSSVGRRSSVTTRTRCRLGETSSSGASSTRAPSSTTAWCWTRRN